MLPLNRMVRNCEIRKVTVTGSDDWETNRVKADRGDTVRWEVFDSDDHEISIWFPGPGVFADSMVAALNTRQVTAKIRDDAPDGVYEYAIYDHTAKRFVISKSHPKIEIPSGGG